MATRRHTNTAAMASAEVGAGNPAFELPRQQLTLLTESACAMFHGFEAMRRIQEKAAHEALAHYTNAAKRLKEANDPAQLLEIQADLMRFDLDGATRYWRQIGAVVVDMQQDMVGRLGHAVETDKLARVAAPNDDLQALTNSWMAFLNGNSRSLVS